MCVQYTPSGYPLSVGYMDTVRLLPVLLAGALLLRRGGADASTAPWRLVFKILYVYTYYTALLGLGRL